ncbi:helix-turn-helix domain-containing protein [Bradyrhizobium sp. 1(2017)]|uniref:helix-turn-helix domain-containing protein n=1 Tax=Bradyrhizobium sp. 1(2017) TaxID=1404888 RepID=UPI00140EEEB1|nr:helix-turn-helix transcriptional regulator [Bradyrhizobium sp. 1(2017)]QIO37333.1 helix-turn-helix transcriptional regulator [Bradyrhizobium sp. 1(2017)]
MNVTKKKKARVARVERLGKKVEVDVEREIGTRVRLARLAKNMSQQELGAEFGLSFQQIQKYEKGTNRVAGSSSRKPPATGDHA